MNDSTSDTNGSRKAFRSYAEFLREVFPNASSQGIEALGEPAEFGRKVAHEAVGSVLSSRSQTS